ncbi:MAG TPA: putative metal-binding motif-containing protein [Kofleriaceae bacterium]|nr:putative metal-binding motif-containing protein [Kofleriaceae bacterium]
MITAATALLGSACGRYHFDERGDGDGDIGLGATCTPSPEVCDGLDNNCDNAVDEGCPCMPFDVTLPVSQGGSGLGLAWTGTRYMVHSADATTWGIQNVEIDGTAGTYASFVSSSTGGRGPMIAWTGSSLVVPFHDAVGHLDVFDGSLQRIAGPTDYSSFAVPQAAEVVRSTDHAVLAWQDNRSGTFQTFVREVAPDGSLTTGEIPVDRPASPNLFAASGDRYYIATSGTSLVMYVVTRSGQIISNMTLAQDPSIAAVDSIAVRADRIAVSWFKSNDTAASYQVLDLDGVPVTTVATFPPLGAKPTRHALLSATSDGFFMAGTTDSPAEIVGMEIRPDGSVLQSVSSLGDLAGVTMYGGVSTVAADHRRVVIVPEIAPLGLRVITTCP